MGMNEIRWWLIKLLAGKDLVVLNAKFHNENGLSHKQGGYCGIICDSEFHRVEVPGLTIK